MGQPPRRSLSAVIAQGSFVATGNNKIIQHLEGGIIKELMVGEGQVVHEGDILLTLDPTPPLANERALKLRRLRLEAVVARPRAEAQGNEEFKIPDIVMKEAGDPDVSGDPEPVCGVPQQADETEGTTEPRSKKTSVRLEFRNKGYEGQRRLLRHAAQSVDRRTEFMEKLSKAGVVRRSDLLAVQRAVADAMGELSASTAELNENEAQVAKYRQEAIIAINANKQEALDRAGNGRFGSRQRARVGPRSRRVSSIAPSFASAGERHRGPLLLPSHRGRRHHHRQADHGNITQQCAADHRSAGTAYFDRSVARGRDGDHPPLRPQSTHDPGADR